jgi:hypothetical protein
MSFYYVLRQVRPPKRSARAHEATAFALAEAALNGTVVVGPYLQSSDPDADSGFGAEVWTDDPAKALRFATFASAMACWQAQSNVRPFRPDGRPNRPLTAYSVLPERIDE